MGMARDEDPSAGLRRAETLFGLRRYEDCLREIEGCLARDPDNVRARVKGAYAFFNLGRYRKSLEYCEQALGTSPEDLSAMYLRSRSLIELGFSRRGEKAARDSLRLRPGATGYYLLGSALSNQGRYAEALVALRDGLELDPRDEEILTCAAGIYLMLGRPDEAEKVLMALPDEIAAGHSAMLLLAEARQLQGRYSEACELSTAYVTEHPENQDGLACYLNSFKSSFALFRWSRRFVRRCYRRVSNGLGLLLFYLLICPVMDVLAGPLGRWDLFLLLPVAPMLWLLFLELTLELWVATRADLRHAAAAAEKNGVFAVIMLPLMALIPYLLSLVNVAPRTLFLQLVFLNLALHETSARVKTGNFLLFLAALLARIYALPTWIPMAIYAVSYQACQYRPYWEEIVKDWLLKVSPHEVESPPPSR